MSNIIDITKILKEIEKPNFDKEKEEFLAKYIDIRCKLSENKISRDLSLFAKLSPDLENRNYYEYLNWDSLQVLADQIYKNKEDGEYLKRTRSFVLSVSSKYREEDLDDANEIVNRFYIENSFEIGCYEILKEISDQMGEISNFRELLYKEISDEMQAFSSRADVLLTADYLRLGFLEDFILEKGIFS